MDAQRIITQATALIPECPAYQISAFLIEFIEEIKTDGKDSEVTLTPNKNQGYSAEIPENVLTISDVYIDGRRAAPSMSEERAMDIKNTYPDDQQLEDDNNVSITDDGNNPLEV